MIDSIITLMEEVATAYTAVNSFSYESPFEINGAPSRLYPHVLVADTPDYQNVGNYRENGIQNQTRWNLRVFLYDVYNMEERGTTARPVKQQTLKNIMDRYLAEVKRKSLHELRYNIEISGGFLAKRAMNGKFEQVTANLTVVTANTCTLGEFEYGE